MTNEISPAKIAQLLTISARQLDERTVSALRDARQKAVEKQVVHVRAFALATGRGARNWIPHGGQAWLLVGFLLAVLVIGIGVWHQIEEQQIEDTDIAILTDDIPIDALVD